MVRFMRSTAPLALVVASVVASVLVSIGCATTNSRTPTLAPLGGPSLIVLGIAQDGGVPQAGSFSDTRWDDPTQRRLVTCLGIIDPRSGEPDPHSGKRWMIDATPDFRTQLLALYRASRGAARPVLDGIFLTHAHMGHYTGLMFLGHESIGAKKVPVYAMPKMNEFLRTNGPWSQLVAYENIALQPLVVGEAVRLAADLSITPLLVPHRQEFSEVVAFRIDGPSRSALFLPDIDSWREWDAQGTRLEDVLSTVDIAYIDGTFFANGEIPGRDMSGFPHPFISHTIERLANLPASERAKVRFIHLNHTNPALHETSAARAAIHAAGMRVAEEGEFFPL
jgi:pyrroloquinoline quinone biosynthesis protein B